MFNTQSRVSLSAIWIVAVVVLLNGCARSMALNSKNSGIDTAKESIGLFTLKTSNIYKPSCQPFANRALVEATGKEKEEYEFDIGLPFKKVNGEFNEYLISIQIPAGEYTLNKILGFVMPYYANGNCGNFEIPVNAKFVLKPNSVVYLGRVEAVNRKRENDNELRAGPILPLLDQAVAGYYVGTFDTKIYDNFEIDISSFAEEYPLIQRQQIDKELLSQNVSASEK